MDDIKLALLGDHEAAKRLTDAGVLLPCPWCGGKQTAVSDVIWPQIICERCGARGPRAYDTFGARLAWNTRAPILSAEEMAELSAVLLKYVNTDEKQRSSLVEHIREEIADVEIMLEQLGIMTGCNYDEYLYKLWRLSRRLGIKAGLDGEQSH